MNTPSAMSKFRSRSDKDHASFFAARNSFASSAINIWQCVAIKKLRSMLSKQSHLVQQWLKQTDSSNSSIQTNADFIVGIYGIKKNWSISIVGNSLIPFSIRRIWIEARFERIQFVNLFHRKIYKYSNILIMKVAEKIFFFTLRIRIGSRFGRIQFVKLVHCRINIQNFQYWKY